MNKQRIATMMISTLITLMVLALTACEGFTVTKPGTSSAYPTFTPSPLSGNNPDAAYAAAQATLAAGQSEMMDLSHQATVISLNKAQAANAAAQATRDYYQHQLLELSIRGTEVSQNMTQAVATQQFITEQTQMAWNATATAQSQAATATYSAYALAVTQTAQAQGLLDVQAMNLAQAISTQVAFSLTATPQAGIQADIVQNRNESERRAWWEDYIATPIIVILLTLIILLLILGAVMAYRRFMPVLELRLRTIISSDNDNPLLLLEGRFLDANPPPHRRLLRWVLRRPNLPQLPSYETTPPVEIIDPSDLSVALWITEAEQQLRTRWRRDDV